MKRKRNFTDRILSERIRESAEKEEVIRLSGEYLQDIIEEWWSVKSRLRNDDILIRELTRLISDNLIERDRRLFSQIAEPGQHISGICITKLFRTPDDRLSYIVHESMSNLLQLNDIKYPYENHKKIYVKPDGLNSKEWGNGRGEITPHCDDLYEEIDTTLLSLTVSRDETKTPTTFYQTKHILENLTDSEIENLSRMDATFISGKNVKGRKINEKRVLDFDEENDNVDIAMDFRIDEISGQRMMPRLRSENKLLQKIREDIVEYDHISSIPETGTFLIVANKKGLHSRDELELDKEQIERVKTGDVTKAPRLLYRSKGPKRDPNRSL